MVLKYYTFFNKKTSKFCNYNVEFKNFVDVDTFNQATFFNQETIIYKMIQYSIIDKKFFKNNKDIELIEFINIRKTPLINFKNLSK